MVLNITGKIEGMKYTALLCRPLKKYSFSEIDKAMEDATFILNFGDNKEIAVSWWVSAKRTRSYPFTRVYDSLSFVGKKVTIIPIFKDEGLDGDRDFLQWDTISLMSLLGIYVIISHYKSAERSSKPGNIHGNKITNQRYDMQQIGSEIIKLLSYQSDALHWNMQQISNITKIGQMAIADYEKISKETGVLMSSKKSAEKKIMYLMKDKEAFMRTSRFLAQKAQRRESITTHAKEIVDGSKSTITITNWLKGNYFFTCDEIRIVKDKIYLIEAKNTTSGNLPSLSDIKEGLIKMNLYCNLHKVSINGKTYLTVPVLKLTASQGFRELELNYKELEMISTLKKEAKINGFLVEMN